MNRSSVCNSLVYIGRPRCTEKVVFIITTCYICLFLEELFVLESSSHFVILLLKVSVIGCYLKEFLLQGPPLGHVL